MKQQEVKDVIIDLLEEIVSRTKYINHHHPGKDMSLDIDLVKDDLRLLYRNYEVLKKLTAELPQPDQKFPQQIQAEEEPPVESEDLTEEFAAREIEETRRRFVEPVPIINAPENKSDTEESFPPASETDSQDAEASDPDSEPAKTVSETEEHLHESTPEDDGNANAEAETEKVRTEPAPEEPSANVGSPEHIDSTGNNSKNKTVLDLLAAYGKKTIGDQYVGQDNSVHQRIAGNKEDKSIGARMQQNRVSSIKEVIGVNEKFLFINELFDGNIQIYYDAIARLNDFENMKAAFDYLNDLSAQYSWDADRSTATIEKLANYVQRRYM